MTRISKALVAILLVSAVAAVAALALGVFPAKRGRPLVPLEASGMPAFEARFDAAKDSTRLLVLFSPT